MYTQIKEEFGVTAPRMAGTSTPEAVARGVVRAIRKDLPEVIVNPGAIRLLLTLASLSPGLGEWLGKRVGANEWFRKVAEQRERQRAETKQETVRS